MLKRHGGWRSTSTAEGYIDDSISNKMEISNKIIKEIHHNVQVNETTVSGEPMKQNHSIQFTNCTITNLYINNELNK